MHPTQRVLPHIMLYHTVPPAPELGGADRITPTQIRVYWSAVPKNESGEPITYYTVKYYPLTVEVRSRRAASVLVNYLNTSENELVISGLDPVSSYAVSVAANSEAGLGTFSNETTAGCKFLYIMKLVVHTIIKLYYIFVVSENSLFQIFFFGAINCQQWVVSASNLCILW